MMGKRRDAGKNRGRAQLELDVARPCTGWGGWRPGAGRPRTSTRVAHTTRPRLPARIPHHVTIRVQPGLASLRRGRTARIVRNAIRAGGNRVDFRVVEFNVLSNHIHLVVEATGAMSLARGMQGLEVRFARRINRALGRRGKLFPDRYHARALKTPREVRAALRYVLNNARHHAAARGERLSPYWVDPCSSGPWFDGWAREIRNREPWMTELRAQPPPNARATVWLLRVGWRRHGLLQFDEVPAGAGRGRAEAPT